MKVLALLPVLTLVTVSAAGPAPKCGKPAIKPDETRIVGGHEAIPGSWPWQVILCVKSIFGGGCRLICGGSIIDETHVLCAAHCVQGQSAKNFRVRVGVFDRTEGNEGVLFGVKSIKYHPMYQSPKQFSHDWSVLTLDTPIVFNEKVSPVCLPKNDSNVTVDGNTCIVTGWGTTSSGGRLPDKLQQVVVPFVNNTECDKSYPGEIDETMVCAGNLDQGGVDSCQGDSGGPLVVKNKETGVWYEYGVVSWGRGCAEAGFPGVYSRVTQACDFVKDLVGREICNDGNE